MWYNLQSYDFTIRDELLHSIMFLVLYLNSSIVSFCCFANCTSISCVVFCFIYNLSHLSTYVWSSLIAVILIFYTRTMCQRFTKSKHNGRTDTINRHKDLNTHRTHVISHAACPCHRVRGCRLSDQVLCPRGERCVFSLNWEIPRTYTSFIRWLNYWRNF